MRAMKTLSIARPRPSIGIWIPAWSNAPAKFAPVNRRPRSVSKMSGLPCFANASYRAATQNEASIALDSRRDSTARLPPRRLRHRPTPAEPLAGSARSTIAAREGNRGRPEGKGCRRTPRNWAVRSSGRAGDRDKFCVPRIAMARVSPCSASGRAPRCPCFACAVARACGRSHGPPRAVAASAAANHGRDGPRAIRRSAPVDPRHEHEIGAAHRPRRLGDARARQRKQRAPAPDRHVLARAIEHLPAIRHARLPDLRAKRSPSWRACRTIRREPPDLGVPLLDLAFARRLGAAPHAGVERARRVLEKPLLPRACLVGAEVAKRSVERSVMDGCRRADFTARC